jgi:MarR family transcriptional regulator for hemolysin
VNEDEKPIGTPYPPGSLDETYHLFTMGIVLAGRRWRALLDEHLRAIGYTTARMEALFMISHSSDRSTQIAIAKRIGIEGPTLTRMLDALAADGLVERVPDQADRRAKRIRLTPRGEAAVLEVRAAVEALRRDILSDFAVEDMVHVNAITARLIDRLGEGASFLPGRMRHAG